MILHRNVVRALALLAALPVCASAPAVAASSGPRNDYAVAAFTAPLASGLKAFYARRFGDARKGFDDALAVVPDNTLALSFLNATAAQTPGELDKLVDAEEEQLAKNPKSALTHVKLGFSYLFSSLVGRNRDVDAREELNAAVTLDQTNQAAHTGLGIMREAERSANRAKTEFLAALRSDPQNVLAKEYLARIYQIDLKDPERALKTAIDVPNLVPDYADIYFHLASIMHDLRQYDAAVAYASRGIETDVGRVGEAGQHGYTLLARIYLDEKKVADARRVLRTSINNNTDTAYAAVLLKKIDDGAYGKPSPGPDASAPPKKK